MLAHPTHADPDGVRDEQSCFQDRRCLVAACGGQGSWDTSNKDCGTDVIAPTRLGSWNRMQQDGSDDDGDVEAVAPIHSKMTIKQKKSACSP